MSDTRGDAFLGGEIPPEYLYDNPDGKRAIAPSIKRIRENIPWLAEQNSWIVWHWNDDAQKIPHRGADPHQQTEWQEPGNQDSLEEAWEAYQEHDHVDGVGFVFNGTEPEILEDFDDCLNPWAFSVSGRCLEDALENDDEPAFFSSSGTGAHRYPVAANAEDTNQHPHEVYIGDDGNHRWAAITGFKIPRDRDEEHGPDRSERVNELSEDYNEAEAKAVDLREFEFDADPAEIDTDAPVPEAIVEAFGGDVPRCVAGLIHVLGTHDPTDDDGPGWGQQTFMRYSYLLMLLADLLGIKDAEELAELVASFKSPAVTATQRGEHPKKDAKPKPHGEGVPWDLDYQAGKITAKVRDGDLYPPKVETIEKRGNMKIGGCDCPIHGGSAGAPEARAATDGGAAAAGGGAGSSAGGDDQDLTWGQVESLFESDANGTTTRGYNVATDILNRDYDFVAVRETGELYYYNPERGFYVRKGETFIAELLRQHIPGHVNISRRNNIRDQIKATNYVDVDAFTPPEGKVNVRNGVLDLESRELEDHSPEYYFTSQLQTPFDRGAEAPLWADFLADSAADERAMKKLEEFIGYCLEVWDHEREKNLFIVGPRQSGKSTFTHVVQALFGSAPSVTNLTPQQIADTQFDAASLKEAMLNAVNDINATKIQDTGTLKRVFSGERLKLERKHQDAHFGAPKAKHMFSANWLPTVVGQDESLYRRILIVEFPNKVSDDDRDEKLKDKLSRELSGILNRALDARERLHEQGGFTNDRDGGDTRRKWDSWRDAHKRYLYQQFEITGDGDDTVEKKAYYRGYKEFAGRKGYELKPQQAVTKSLKWVPEVVVRDDSYAGLAWKEEDAAEETERWQSSLDKPQEDRIKNIRTLIAEIEDDHEQGAPVEEVLERAEELGIEESKAMHEIDKLRQRGELYEPADGHLRTC